MTALEAAKEFYREYEVSVGRNIKEVSEGIYKAELPVHGGLALGIYLKTELKQWLLLVIGGINGSSYAVNGNLQIDLALQQYDEVYLLGDLSENLYQIK